MSLIVSGFQHLPKLTYEVVKVEKDKQFCQVTSLSKWHPLKRIIVGIIAVSLTVLSLTIAYRKSENLKFFVQMSLFGKVTYKVNMQGDTPSFTPKGQINRRETLRLSKEEIFFIATSAVNYKAKFILNVESYSVANARGWESLEELNKGITYRLEGEEKSLTDVIHQPGSLFAFGLIPAEKRSDGLFMAALGRSGINFMWGDEAQRNNDIFKRAALQFSHGEYGLHMHAVGSIEDKKLIKFAVKLNRNNWIYAHASLKKDKAFCKSVVKAIQKISEVDRQLIMKEAQ